MLRVVKRDQELADFKQFWCGDSKITSAPAAHLNVLCNHITLKNMSSGIVTIKSDDVTVIPTLVIVEDDKAKKYVNAFQY